MIAFPLTRPLAPSLSNLATSASHYRLATPLARFVNNTLIQETEEEEEEELC